MTDLLSWAGWEARDLQANLSKIPRPLLDRLPSDPVSDILAGRLPTWGFGLVGPNRIGKTMAICALVAAGISKVTPTTHLRSVALCHWGVESFLLRNQPTNPETLDRIEHLAHVPLLILDDLGQERSKGSYTEDWSKTSLAYIIQARDLGCRPILWTSNGDKRELIEAYGASTISRLLTLAPIVNLSDLRGENGR